LRDRRKAVEEGRSKVPGYIVTYSDMVTLLLTFFVMLMSLSSMQDPELFNKGRGAFVESVRALGLGMLYGRKPSPDFGDKKIKHYISDPDELYGRTIDAKEEEIRRLFKQVTQLMTTMPSQIIAERTDFSVTNIRFAPGEATLDEPAKKFLTEFCADLQQDSDLITHAGSGAGFPLGGNPRGILYVLGLAGDEETERQQWVLSARRAQAAAEFLQETLPPEAGPHAGYSSPEFSVPWHICWWGAGPGGDWVTQDSPISKNCQILIAVLKAGD
jgi:chemotaxis protein MotB